jgi:hypothetical protein
MAISNPLFNSAQQSSGTVMGQNTGFTGVLTGNGGIGSTIGLGGTVSSAATQTAHYQSEMVAYYDKQTNIRITHVENGFIVETGNEGKLIRKYIAKDMDEVRDLITSDMVTQRMEGK